MIDSVPSQLDERTSDFAASNATASDPAPIGSRATIAPLFALTTIRVRLPHEANSRRFEASMANPVGPSQPGRGHCAVTVSDATSIRAIELQSSMLTKRLPASSVTANSGRPGKAMVATARPARGSIAVALRERPLKVNPWPEGL